MIQLKPMDAASAHDMLVWRYPAPYEQYNTDIENIEDEVAYLTDPANHFYAIFEDDTFVGHAVFHGEGRVPGGDYTAEALDVGIGLRPELTGQGRGTHIGQAVLDFAKARYGAAHFRATVAAWNTRAQQVCLNIGFKIVSRFKHPKSGMEFVILWL